VHRIAAAPFARRGFEQHHAGARLARHQRGAQGGVAAADHQNIHFHSVSKSRLAPPEWREPPTAQTENLSPP
jgi:hypothetical protein